MRLGNNLAKGRNNEENQKSLNIWLTKKFQKSKKSLAYNELIHNKFTKKNITKSLGPVLSHRHGLKIQTNSKIMNNKLQSLRKQKLVKPLKSLAIT